MNILFLSEGNPTTRDSWSGISKSVVEHLQMAGHRVEPGDVELEGMDRAVTAAVTVALDRNRWRARYHLGRSGFSRRSRNAQRKLAEHRHVKPDVVFQIGATFHLESLSTPYVVYCDSSMWVAELSMHTGHSYANWLTSSERREVKERERRVYEGAEAIFTISERLRRSFIEDVGIPADRVVTVHAGPNFEGGIPDLAHSVSKQDERPTVLFVGRQFERKGGPLLLQAFSKVRERIPSARLIVVGPDAPDVVPAGVEWLGFLDKDEPTSAARLDEAYRRADVFCLPTLWEPFGIVFLEAMFHGLPCIGTNIWAIPEMIEEGSTGFLVERGDHEALAQRLFQVLSDRAMAREMGRRARSRVEEHFTWEGTVSRMLKVVLRIVEK